MRGRRERSTPPSPRGSLSTNRSTRAFFLKLGTGQVGLKDLVLSEDLELDGRRTALVSLVGLLDGVEADFPIVTTI